MIKGGLYSEVVAGDSSDTAAFSCAEHERLVDLTETLSLGFKFCDLLYHLGGSELEVSDVSGGWWVIKGKALSVQGQKALKKPANF